MAPEVQNYSHTKYRAVKELFPAAWAGRNRYCRLLQDLVVNGFLALRLVFFLDMAWFASSATVNSQNYQYWCSEKPSAVHLVLCRSQSLMCSGYTPEFFFWRGGGDNKF